MGWLLDTNIISNVARPAPPTLLAWMAEQEDSDLRVSALTVAEIHRGVLEKPAGKRRNQFQAWFNGPEGPQALFAGRVLAFDGNRRVDLGPSHGGGHQGPAAQRTRHDDRRRRKPAGPLADI